MARWTKGQSGNRNGRPKTGKPIGHLARLQVDKHKLIQVLAGIAAGEHESATVDVNQQLRAIQLLLAYGYGPPQAENEVREGLKIEVIYVESHNIAIAEAPSGARAGDPAIQAVQCGLLRPPLGKDDVGDGSPDPSGPGR
jgi:hypothetical protein